MNPLRLAALELVTLYVHDIHNGAENLFPVALKVARRFKHVDFLLDELHRLKVEREKAWLVSFHRWQVSQYMR